MVLLDAILLMNQFIRRFLPVALLAGAVIPMSAADAESADDLTEVTEKTSFLDRWHVLGYVEMAMQRNFDKLGSHHAAPMGDYPAWRLNLPKGCVWAEFDCGKGWVVGTQVNVVNEGSVPTAGTDSPDDRPMGWGCEVSLDEIWIMKRFSDAAGLKIGLIGTPVGQQNDCPDSFFGVIRPEDGPEFLAINNQSPSISFEGTSHGWTYVVMAIPGFVNYDFGNGFWKFGDGIYERTINRLYSGAFWVNNRSIPGLSLCVSGEFGGGVTSVETGDDKPERRMNTSLALAGFDWAYDDHDILFRGAYQYGYMGCHEKNNGMTSGLEPIRDMQAMSLGAEIGYDMFSLNRDLVGKQKFYVFGRYDWSQYQDRDAQEKAFWNAGHRVTFGVNWYPIDNILVKADVGFGFKNDPSRIFTGCSIAWLPQWNQ